MTFEMSPILRFDGAVRLSPGVDAWLDARTPGLGDIARDWFDRMRACGDDVLDLVHDGFPTACVEDAPFAYVNVFRPHVNVGFYLGAILPDPAHLLEGTGKRMRHVKLKPGPRTNTEALTALIDAAYHSVKAHLDYERSVSR